MATLSKACKPDNFELHNSLKFSFTNIKGLCSNFVDCESFLESNSPDILALCETNLDDSIDSGNFSVRGYLPLIRKDSSTHMHGLAVYAKEGLAFVFGDFNIHHKDWLTHSGGTDRPGELCYNFSISNDLTQIVNFPTQVPDCDSHSPALLDLFLSSDANICSTMAFPPLGNSDHVVVSVSIDFPINSKQDTRFIA